MNKLLLLQTNFTPFISAWGVQCEATPCNEGFIVPDGWQEELTARNIEFTEVNENEITFPNDQP